MQFLQITDQASYYLRGLVAQVCFSVPSLTIRQLIISLCVFGFCPVFSPCAVILLISALHWFLWDYIRSTLDFTQRKTVNISSWNLWLGFFHIKESMNFEQILIDTVYLRVPDRVCKSLPGSMSVCFCCLGAVAACDFTSTDSAVLSQCSTIEEQTQTPSPPPPPPTCKLTIV